MLRRTSVTRRLATLRALSLLSPLVALVPGSASADPPSTPPAFALVNAKSGLCVDPAGDDAASRAPVSLAACDGKPDQRWWFRPGDDGAFEIVNAKSGLCLDVKGYDAAEHDEVMLYACDKKDDQLWTKDSGMSGSAFAFRNKKGLYFQMNGMLMENKGLCLDFKGSSGSAGSAAKLYRCGGTALQSFTTAGTGVALKPPTAAPNAPGRSQMCASDFGPCVEGAWTASGSRWTASGAITLAKLPMANVTFGLDAPAPGIGLDLTSATELGIVGNGRITAKFPLSGEVIDVGLPSGLVRLGTGAGVTALLGKGYQYAIGGRPYVLQPGGFYAHAAINAAFSLGIAGLTATIPAGRSGEIFLGFENRGPSIYLSGDCNIPIVGPPKEKDGPPTSIANISSCTLGWFGSQPLPHTLSLKLLDPTRGMPAIGGALPVVDGTVDAAVLVGGAISFAALPGIQFNGMMAIDPDSTVANSVTFRNLANLRAGLEGTIDLSVLSFSMTLAQAAALYDNRLKQLDVAASIPAEAPLDRIGSAFGKRFSGKAYAYGRFAPSTNQLAFDFSKAKLYDFDLDTFQGQLDFGKKELTVAGKLEFGQAWVALGGVVGPSKLALTGGSGMTLDGVSVASSSLTVGTSGVTFKGSVNMRGRTWSFDETLSAPRTIKSNVVNINATIPVINLGGKFDVWAQYTMGGNLTVKAKLTQSIGGLSTSETYTVDTDGKITMVVVGQDVKVKVL